MIQVFVYGSLKRGHSNHGFLHGADLLGAHTTRAAYTLLDLGYFPGVISGGTTAIQGEIYRIDDDTLRALDRLEGHPELYQREVIATPYGSAYIYLLTAADETYPVIESGVWQGPDTD